MAFGSEYKSGSGAYFGAPIAIASENPLDPRMVVENYSDLIDLNSWAIQGTDTGNKGFNTAYHGMITAVKAPADKAGLYQLVKSSDSSTAKADLQSYANWQKISVSEAEFTAILNRVTAVEASDAKKLDKDFVTQSSQGTLGEGTTFAARSDNTPEATNVYITGKQIKDFAASTVSDKGTFADDTALKAAYPTPEDGWSATVLSTGTTWISTGGQWTDSGKANGVTSVNGKSGNVTLVAADIDDVLSDTETDEHIQAAFTADRTDLTTTAKSVVGGINEVKAATTKNAGDITANATAIASKQDSTINLEIQGATAATVSDALTSLDTALTSVKSTADDAAKKDASNIEAATWKTVLGYQNADEVATAVNNGITTNEYSTLATTAKTVVGAINEVKGVADAAAKADASNITVSTWKDKLGFITSDEVPEQVQVDWLAKSGTAQILNKPDIEPVSEGSSNALNIGKNSSIDTLNINIGNGTEGGRVNIKTSSMSMYENDNTTSDITLEASCTNTSEGDKEHTGKLVVGAGVNIDGGIDGVNVNSLAINKATLVVGDNTIPLATAGKIVCKSGVNVTEFVVNGESVVKEILSGSDIFSISDYADGSYTLASTAAGNAIIMNI